MKRFFGKQGWNRFLSVILVIALVAGTVGMNQMFVNAEDVVYPTGVPTVATGGFVGNASGTAEDVVEEQVQQGVKISLPANSYARVHSKWCPRVLSDGYRVDIEDFAIAENESFFMVLGPTSGGDYFDNLSSTQIYGIIYESDGDFVVMSAASGCNLHQTGTVLAATSLTSMSLIDKFSIYIQSDGSKWDIVVDTYKEGVKIGDSYTTSIATTYTQTYFNFGAVGYATITDATTATITGWTNTSAASYMVSYTGIPVQSVSLNTATITLSKGTTSALQATISPTTAVNQVLNWSSSDNNIATVDADGNVTAVAEGVATITATSSEDATKKATCEVKVVKSNLSADDFNLQGSVPTYADAEDGVGVKVVYPTTANGTERLTTSTKYSMKDELHVQIDDIQAVDENYSIVVAIGDKTDLWSDKAGYMLLIGKSGKVAIVESSSTDGSPNNQTTIATGTINELNGDISLVISQSDSNYIIEVNGAAYTIPGATSILASSGEHYLAFGVMSDFTITDGDVSGVKYWQTGAYIGRTQDVSFVIRNITVASTGVSLDKEYINLFVEENTALTATVSPLTASQGVNWTSADKTIATVDANGQVTAVKAGTTIIKATSKIDADKTATCVVRVTDPSKYLTRDYLSNTWDDVVDLSDGGGVQVSYTSSYVDSYKRVETKYTDKTKYAYWPSGNGVHLGVQDIQLAASTDTVAIFFGNRITNGTSELNSNYNSLWLDSVAGGYAMFYSRDGSFAIAVVKKNASSTKYIDTVLVSEKRETLQGDLSFDVRYEDGYYEVSVNGKTYKIAGTSADGCPLQDVDDYSMYFAVGLVKNFSVDDDRTINGLSWSGPSAASSFTLTDISHITTEELCLAPYTQSTLAKQWDGDMILGDGEYAVTTDCKVTDFDGTLDDSSKGLVWEVTAVDDGYTVKVKDGDESSYLNISENGVSLGTVQTLTIERVSSSVSAYNTISDGTNYLCITADGLSVSDSSEQLVLYNVTPEAMEETEEEPLFTLSTFSDLHGERVFNNGEEEYIREGIVEATAQVRKEDNANIIAFLGDLISDKNGVEGDEVLQHGYWYAQGTENVESEWQKARDLMYAAAESATESGRALYLTGNHEYAIGGTRANPAFNSGDYTDGIESKLPELTEENAYFQKAEDFPQDTDQSIIDAGHVLSYHYNIDGMDIVAINPSYTGAEITEGFSYNLDALDWMDAKLAEIGKDKTVLVLGHYPTTSLNNETGLNSYNKIKEIFAKYPNVIYIYGHDHNPYIHTDTYQRVQTFADDGVTAFQNRYETPTGYTEVFGGSVAFTNDVGLSTCAEDGTPAVVQGLLVKVYSDRIVLQMKNYNESPLGMDALREYTIMRDVKLNVAENPQEAKVEEYTTAFPNFRDGEAMEAPVAPVGYVFAGWYYDESCTQPIAVGTTTVVEDKQIFAKFLPQDVLSVKAQLKLADGTTTDSIEGTTEMRLITTIDSKLDYQDVGFLINGNPYKCKYAYTSLTAAGFTKTPDVFNACSKRFVTRNIINLRWNTTTKLVDRPIKVQAFWTTCDGTEIYGQERTITIKQGLEAIASSESADYSLR